MELAVSTGRSLGQLLLVGNTLHNAYGHGNHPIADGLKGGHGFDHDHLGDARIFREFLKEYEVKQPSAPLTLRGVRRLRELRAAVHGLVDSNSSTFDRLSRRFLGLASYQVDREGRVTAQGEGWDVFIDEVALGLIELARHGSKLRRCENPECRWIYVDRSRAQTRRWCEMGSCGNRNKVRLYRRRQSRSRGRRVASRTA